MKKNRTSGNYQKDDLKVILHFADHTGDVTSNFDVYHKQVIPYSNSNMKSEQIDSDKK